MTILQILDPRSGPGLPVTSYEVSTDTGVVDLRVALLSNCFFDASNLLEAVGACLSGLLRQPRILLYESRNASIAAAPDLIARIAADNDAVVCALGHCGSCTSSATRNAVAVARAGLPACILATERFREASAFVARSVGMPDIPRVYLPHPVAGTGKERIREIAGAAAPSVIAAWEKRRVSAAA